MLSAHQITKTYGIHTVLQDITFNINPTDRLGLIGPNGCGKSTLLRILAGQEEPDSGAVTHTQPGLRTGYLAQGLDIDPDLTLADACLPGAPRNVENELVKLAAVLITRPKDEVIQRAYDEALQDLQYASIKPAGILTALGLNDILPEKRVGELSGGQKTRLKLARLLLTEPTLLLLDEPTNHLDIGMLEWLENWLTSFQGAALIVSHDRAFLDNTVNFILELDQNTHTLKQYAGNYSKYIEKKEAERSRQLQAYLDQQAEIRRMQADIVRTREQAAFTERQASSIRIGGSDYKIKGYKSYQQGIAKKVAAKAKSREKKLNRFLESEDRAERPHSDWQMKLNFSVPQHLSQEVLVTENLSVGYPGSPALLTDLRLQVRGSQRLVLTGPNGCGKTTLLRTFAGELAPLEGSLRIGPSIKVGYMAQEQELLDPMKSPVEIIEEAGAFNQTRARTFLHAFLFGGEAPLHPCGEMSYGERARLELARLIARGCTFLLLDEPINHLDIPSRARFEQALNNFAGTILAVVHDRYFIERFASDIWTVEDGKIKKE
jgi:ATP-binding cassette, subfamily F, member 3